MDENVILRVLEVWPGTPEELGRDLHEAMGAYREDREKQASARRRILECDGGRELLEAEAKQRAGR